MERSNLFPQRFRPAFAEALAQAGLKLSQLACLPLEYNQHFLVRVLDFYHGKRDAYASKIGLDENLKKSYT